MAGTSTKSTRVNFRLPNALHAQLLWIASQERRALSQLITFAVEDYLAARPVAEDSAKKRKTK